MSKWKQMVLGDMGYTYGGLTNKTIVDFGFGKPFIPYMNIFSNGKINPKFLVLVNIHPGERQNTVKYGDLFFTTSSETVEEVGMTSVLLDDIGEAYLNSFCFGFRLNNFDDLLPEFAPFLFRGLELRKKISLFGQGSTRYNLPKTELLAKLKIDLPTIPEQRKIAKILSTTDSVIEKTHAAIAKYKAIKQGILHDLFTRGIDIKTGKLRPKQEEAPEFYKESELGWIPKEWDKEILGNVSDIIMGQSPDSIYYNTSNQGLPLIQGNADIKERKSIQRIWTSQVTKFIDAGDIIMTVRAPVGLIGIASQPSCAGRGICAFKTSNINSIYLFYLLIFHEDSWRSLEQGSTFTAVGSIEVYNFPLSIARSLTEQQLIADKLISIDKKINTEQKYLQKIQQMKSGIMADLLSGKKIVTA
jgi:type I restriction enzyme S subunit